MAARRCRATRFRGIAVGLVAMTLGIACAHAGSVSVSPLRIAFAAGVSITTLTIENGDERPAVVQIEALSWTQAGGADVLTPSNDIVAVPPIVTLGPRAKRVVRLGLQRAPDAARELAYRIMVTEVPQARSGEAIDIAVRHGIPGFVAPSAAPTARLTARARDDAIVIENNGATHLRYTSLRLVDANRATLVEERGLRYVLPGATQVLSLSHDLASAARKLELETTAGSRVIDVDD